MLGRDPNSKVSADHVDEGNIIHVRTGVQCGDCIITYDVSQLVTSVGSGFVNRRSNICG